VNIGSLVQNNTWGKGIVIRKEEASYVVVWYEQRMTSGKPVCNVVSRATAYPLRWKDVYGDTVTVLSLGGG
jgi:hypothetical protein